MIIYEDLLKLSIKDKGQWGYTTLDNIDFIVGYQEGDLTKPCILQLGECGNVHALIGGESGSGKSNMLNCGILNCLEKYSPDWLQMWLIDFKLNTAAMYGAVKQNIAPQFNVISGTKDGAYAKSIFEELVNEQGRRQEFFKSFQMQKIKEYNKAVLAGKLGPEYKIMPRIFVIFDEYQAMFKAVDRKISDYITLKISQLASEARSVGIHVMLCSQSTDGGVPKSILKQFNLRGALRCDADTSNSIIGNSAAENLRGFGWVIFNEDKGKLNFNKNIRVPYLDDQILLSHLKALAEKGRVEGNSPYDCELFSEDEKIDYSRLQLYRDRFPALREEKNAVLLGDRLDYTAIGEPAATLAGKGDGINYMVAGMHTNQNAMIAKSIIYQLRNNPKNTFAGTIFDKNLAKILKIEELLPTLSEEGMKEEHTSELIEAMSEVLNHRLKTGTKEEDSDLYYVLIGTDKSKMFETGAGKDYDKLVRIAKMGPSVGIHLILISRDLKSAPQFRNASKYIIMTLLDEAQSRAIIDEDSASKLEEGQAILLENRIKKIKFKIPQMEVEKISEGIYDYFK